MEIGEKIFSFELVDNNNNKVNIYDIESEYLILYFYPKDNTSGCTQEALDFSEKIEEFKKLNAEIIGISPDSVLSHQKFIEKNNLKIKLLSDNEKEISKKFGVLKRKSMYGKEYMGIERTTFLLNKEKIIIKKWEKVKVKGHVEEVLNYINSILSK